MSNGVAASWKPLRSDPYRVVRWLGVANLFAWVWLAVISYGVAPGYPFQDPQPREAAALREVARWVGQMLPALGPFAHALASGELLAGHADRLAAYVPPTVFLCLTSWVAMGTLALSRREPGAALERALFRFGVAYAVIGVFAYPMLAHDFWLSPVHGRMWLDGANPFYTAIRPDVYPDIPIDEGLPGMTYGPLWAMGSAGLALLGARNPAFEFLVHKAVLAACWIAMLTLVRQLLAESSARRRAVAIVALGWLPVSVWQSVYEGHNDVVMVVLVLLWLRSIQAERPGLAVVALTCSALVKYATAPLLGVELLRAWRSGDLLRRDYLVAAAGSGLLVLACFAPFWRGLDFFEPLSVTRTWVFLSPTAALADGLRWAGIAAPLWGVHAAVTAVVLLPLVAALRAFFRDGSYEDLAVLALCVMTAALFVVLRFSWPWYLLWPLALAVLVPDRKLSAFLVALATVAPLSLAWWMAAPSRAALVRPNIILFAAALVLTWPAVYATRRLGAAERAAPR